MSSQPLHPLEKALLRGLAGVDWIDLESASKSSEITLDQTRRAVEWLKGKALVSTKEQIKVYYKLGSEGKRAATNGLPERRITVCLNNSGGNSDIKTLARELGVEFSIALGRARKNEWVSVSGESVTLLPTSSLGKEPEENILELLAKSDVSKDQLSSSEIETIQLLMKRLKGLIEEVNEKEIFVSLTELGRKIKPESLEDEIELITPGLLRSGEWKTKPIRAIDVTSPAPNVFAGRIHPMRSFMDEVREAFLSLGFEEILGPIAHSALWNFDALFIPQQHSAREMQDTFYVSGAKADLREYQYEMKSIKTSHESGGGTGSLGWKYPWSQEEASRVVLRTHTTAVTISYLATKKPQDARVFSVGKVFRNEKSNYKHNPEFSQIEGVMVGKNLNLRNLVYIISKFYSKLGFEKIKFWPTYFPYTEPSLQTMAYYEPAKSWMELGGMGIFRPEVTVPLGVKNPVLAWGLSLDRLVMLRYNVNDLRLLFGANLGWLRSLKIP
ncbi:MAG: phenylalanine--tRNA ligase subunit alpha [Nitrososphaerales archaeon]